jgi:hypothetical protein
LLPTHHSDVLESGCSRRERDLLLDGFEIGQVKHADVQGVEQPVHGFQAETAAGVEEVGKMALLKPGLAGQTGSGQLPPVDSAPDVGAQFVLQVLKCHGIVFAKSYTCTLVIFLEQ